MTKARAELASAMHARWIEFARTGQLTDWPAYDRDRPVMAFAKDNTTAVQIVPDPPSVELQPWDGVELHQAG